MIDAREVFKNLRLSPEDETEVRRLGGEIVAAMRSPKFDGRPMSVDVPLGETSEQKETVYRVVCALQQRFQANLWSVTVDAVSDAYGKPTAHRLWFFVDGRALRGEPTTTAAASDQKRHETSREPAEVKSFRLLREDLACAALVEPAVAAAASDEETARLADATLRFVDDVTQAMRRLKDVADSVKRAAR